jgi:exosome complex RNA-binding protein Csl4
MFAQIINGYGYTEQLIIATLGAVPTVLYPINSKVQVNTVGSWLTFDREKTEAAGLSEGDWVNGVIEKVEKFNSSPYTVKIEVRQDDNTPVIRLLTFSVDQVRKDGIIPSKDQMNFGDLL